MLEVAGFVDLDRRGNRHLRRRQGEDKAWAFEVYGYAFMASRGT